MCIRDRFTARCAYKGLPRLFSIKQYKSWKEASSPKLLFCLLPVSYTHLDVYKRQANASAEGGDGAEDVKRHGSKMLVGPRPPQNAIFIHKLYQILEDDSLHDLIWWTPSGSSFMIKPVERFSKALATYFKHTNITSFVRQLNIYGFHKVSHDHNSNDANSGDDANTNDDNNANDDNSGNKNSSGDENSGAGAQEKEKSCLLYTSRCV